MAHYPRHRYHCRLYDYTNPVCKMVNFCQVKRLMSKIPLTYEALYEHIKSNHEPLLQHCIKGWQVMTRESREFWGKLPIQIWVSWWFFGLFERQLRRIMSQENVASFDEEPDISLLPEEFRKKYSANSNLLKTNISHLAEQLGPHETSGVSTG